MVYKPVNVINQTRNNIISQHDGVFKFAINKNGFEIRSSKCHEGT